MRQIEYRQLHYIYDEEKQVKTCGKCQKIKSFSEFNPRRAKTGPRYQSYCKSCCTQNARLYRKNKSIVYGRPQEEIQWYLDLKSQPCTDCGVTYPWYVNDWDHLNDKEEIISYLLTQNNPTTIKDRILAEISKCELVCSNCHRIRTRNRIEAKRKALN